MSFAQDEDSNAAASEIDESLAESLPVIESLHQALVDIEAGIEEKKKELQRARAEGEQERLAAETEQLEARAENLRADFSNAVIAFDPSRLLNAEDAAFSWDQEAQEIFSPLIVELRKLTDRPRRMERYRREIESSSTHSLF